MSDFTPERGSDGRDRPKYGEYATPEEQRARIAHPESLPAPAPAAAANEHWAGPAPAWTAAPAAPAASRRARPRTADRFATLALLVYGLITVVTAFPALVEYVGYAHTLLSALGVDAQLSDPAGARAWGVAAAIVLAVGWLATAALSFVSLRAGRLTWWIPLVAGVVFNTVSALLLLMPLVMDAAVWEALQSAIGG